MKLISFFFKVFFFQSPVLFPHKGLQSSAFPLPVGSVLVHLTLKGFNLWIRGRDCCSQWELKYIWTRCEKWVFGLFKNFYIIRKNFSRQQMISGIGQFTLQRVRFLMNIDYLNSGSKKIIISFNFEDFSIQRK